LLANKNHVTKNTGDYSVESEAGKMMSLGTLPTELGKLRKWKFVLFSELIIFLLHKSIKCSLTFGGFVFIEPLIDKRE